MKTSKTIFSSNLKTLLIGLTLASNISFNCYATELDQKIREVQILWENAKYTVDDKEQKITEYEQCVKKAEDITKAFPNDADGYIWEGICLASEAELNKLSALGKVKEARTLFEKALKINDNALEGSAYTNLGVLYQRVPSWPISYGNDEMSEKYFKKALEIAPNNIDANYFYALFLEEQDQYQEALKHLEIASKAPSRHRPLADTMRKDEIKKAIQEIKNEL